MSADLSHEAGFDALMTSMVFVLQLNHVLAKKKLAWHHVDFKQPRAYTSADRTRSVMDLLQLMVNRIRLVKTQPSFVNLSGRDESDMSRHFMMTGFPTNWRKWEVMKVWSPIWVNVSPIDETSCWVIVKSDDDVKNLQTVYRMMQQPQFKLLTYEEYRRQQQEAAPK
eukprot:GDKI01042788.1.p1 GENE.GDKI01042788.1~~GDKI01042788.1.p1  ORF type:complete len:167 (+),score=44.60 GDKI01042788.1:35-535(+)